jgi:hypothetical protein
VKPRVSDVLGLGRLAVHATLGVTDVVEAMHRDAVRAPRLYGAPPRGRTRGITGLVYRGVRGVTRLVGGGTDAMLARLATVPGAALETSPQREQLLAALNGVVGDHLAASGNPLAISMRLRVGGRPLEPDARAIAAALPRPGGRVLVLVHGLCLNDLQWTRKGHDHGAALAAEHGWTPLYLHYNTGLHVSANGRALAALLESLLRSWPVPVEELAVVGHSMGGLVSRSACHYGAEMGHAWPRRLRRLVFLGTPHHGAPLERGGSRLDTVLDSGRYTAALARLGRVRSAGITDLRHGSLLDEDWAGRDRFARGSDGRAPVPLPRGVACHAIAATTGRRTGDARDRLLGDGLVPLHSALSLPLPADRQWIGYGMGHLDLLHRREVYEKLREWLAG